MAAGAREADGRAAAAAVPFTTSFCTRQLSSSPTQISFSDGHAMADDSRHSRPLDGGVRRGAAPAPGVRTRTAPPDLAHPAGAKRREDFVGTESSAGCQRQRVRGLYDG